MIIQEHTETQKDKIDRTEGYSASSMLTKFSTYRFSFVTITRTFQKWPNIRKQRKYKTAFQMSLKGEVEILLFLYVVESLKMKELYFW